MGARVPPSRPAPRVPTPPDVAVARPRPWPSGGETYADTRCRDNSPFVPSQSSECHPARFDLALTIRPCASCPLPSPGVSCASAGSAGPSGFSAANAVGLNEICMGSESVDLPSYGEWVSPLAWSFFRRGCSVVTFVTKESYGDGLGFLGDRWWTVLGPAGSQTSGKLYRSRVLVKGPLFPVCLDRTKNSAIRILRTKSDGGAPTLDHRGPVGTLPGRIRYFRGSERRLWPRPSCVAERVGPYGK
jgi:hypothetical protein